MTKFEFLGDLSRLIADLPEDEREQAMEYYEDYFADAGPEKEQEIIKDFVSPSYIAEQLREASARRQKMYANLQKEPSSAPQTAAEQPAQQAVSTQQAAVQTVQQAAPMQRAIVQPVQQTVPMQQAAVQPVQQAVPTQSAAVLQEQVPPAAIPASETSAPADPQPDSSAMRNPIFQQDSEGILKEKEEALALRKKTKVDIKSINANTSKMDKKQLKAAKKAAAEERQYEAALYSGPKKAILAVLLIITSPVSLSVLAVIIGLFLVLAGIVICCVVLGISALTASIVSLLLCIVSLLTAHIPNCIFTLGSTLLLFSAGVGVCYASFKLVTRVIPSAYFSVIVLFNNIKASLAKFAMK